VTASRAASQRAVVALLSVLIAAMVIRRIRIAARMRRGDRVVIDARRARNRRGVNRLVTTLGRAGRRHSIFAIIEVSGRRSQRRYATPVRVMPQSDAFIVPLTYGSRTGWYLNLLAHPGELHWQGRVIPVGNPTLVPTGSVIDHFPLPSRFLLWLDGTKQCVRLDRIGPAPGH
jgi:hypothetical protein